MAEMDDKKPKGGMAIMIGIGKPKDAPPADDEQMPEGGEPDGDEGGEYKIPLPEGFQAPDDKQDGEPFDATIRCYTEGGQLCITSINGVKTKEGEDTEGEETDEKTLSDQSDQMPETPQSLDQAVAMQKKHKYQ